MRRPYVTRILRSEQRLEDRYVLAGLLIIGCILVFAFAGDGRLGRTIVVVLESVTLIVILRASQARPGTVRITGIVCAVLVAAVAVTHWSDGTWAKAAPTLLGAALALGAPLVIVRRLVRQTVINFTTVAGALCVYLLAGLFFALLYGTMAVLHHGDFFAQQHGGSGVDFVYFSFVTLTTTGYGDLTAAIDAGRMSAILEALFGQLYLVSIVALLVANMGRTRTRPTRETGAVSAAGTPAPTIEGTT
jgi:ion channel